MQAKDKETIWKRDTLTRYAQNATIEEMAALFERIKFLYRSATNNALKENLRVKPDIPYSSSWWILL
ncbi:hypothetical protein CW304_09235 [Bacillus sp. UFRGS-B20]|nr:hypothetical protein CW304_09235 [Bacillus sp. UFRGS-B20]